MEPAGTIADRAYAPKPGAPARPAIVRCKKLASGWLAEVEPGETLLTQKWKHYQVVRLTAKKRMRATLTAIRDKLYQRRHEPVPIVGKWLQRVLNGYFAYHAVPTNLLRLNGFRSEVCRAWRHALLRRSQRHRLNWSRFNRLTRKYVPSCRVLHPYPEERFFASRP
jgi:hypothetical protein